MTTNSTTTPRSFAMNPSHHNVVKEFFSIKDFNYEFDIRLLIQQVKRTRTAQKKYFAGARTAEKQELLLDAKQEEIRLEQLCNRMWSKHVQKGGKQ